MLKRAVGPLTTRTTGRSLTARLALRTQGTDKCGMMGRVVLGEGRAHVTAKAGR